MTRRREIERELEGLGEIRGIFDAMRNLAVLETHKIQRFLAAQRRAVQTLEAATADVARFHAPERRAQARTVVVLMGSERGFCGDFNEALLHALEPARADTVLVAVGARLAGRLGSRAAFAVAGPTVAEDVDATIGALARGLSPLLEPGAELAVLHHEPEAAEPRRTPLEPFPAASAAPAAGTAPRLNLAPQALLAQLAEQVLFARLQTLAYASLLAENERRMRHMEAATRRLDEDRERLRSRRNVLRQEEITEEIEVIMLSAE